jgi:hypothetical protein
MPKKTSSAPRVPGSSSRSTTGQSVVVNVEMTVYEAIRRCAKERGWALQDRKGGAVEQSQGYDLYWTDRSVTRMRVQRLAPNQMLNHFPGMVSLCSKVSSPDPKAPCMLLVAISFVLTMGALSPDDFWHSAHLRCKSEPNRLLDRVGAAGIKPCSDAEGAPRCVQLCAVLVGATRRLLGIFACV